VFYELEKTVSYYFLAIDIVKGSLSSLADLLLMLYLRNSPPVKKTRVKVTSFLTMSVPIYLYLFISVATKGTNIWSFLAEESDGTVNGDAYPGANVFQSLNTGSTGVELLFALGFVLLCILFIHRLPEQSTQRKRLSSAVALLAAFFLARNVVNFTFTLVYVQFSNGASLNIQLIYWACYGLLSIFTFLCIAVMENVKAKIEIIAGDPRTASGMDVFWTTTPEVRQQEEKFSL
jgi:hypothetical protein